MLLGDLEVEIGQFVVVVIAPWQGSDKNGLAYGPALQVRGELVGTSGDGALVHLRCGRDAEAWFHLDDVMVAAPA